MLGRGDAHRVDIFASDDFAEVRIGGAAFVLGFSFVGFLDTVLACFTSRSVDIAHGHRLDIAEAEQGRKMIVVRHLAAADERKGDAFARRSFVLGPKVPREESRETRPYTSPYVR